MLLGWNKLSVLRVKRIIVEEFKSDPALWAKPGTPRLKFPGLDFPMIKRKQARISCIPNGRQECAGMIVDL
jgi:hypothetical protein